MSVLTTVPPSREKAEVNIEGSLAGGLRVSPPSWPRRLPLTLSKNPVPGFMAKFFSLIIRRGEIVMQPPPRREAGRMTVWSLRPLQVNVGHAAGQKGHVNCTVRDLQRVGRKCIAAPDIPLSSAPGKDALWAACLPVSPVSNAQAPANQTSLQIIGWDGGVTPARWLPWSGDRVSPPGPSATKMDRATRALGSSAYISLSVALNRAPEPPSDIYAVRLRSLTPSCRRLRPPSSSTFFPMTQMTDALAVSPIRHCL